MHIITASRVNSKTNWTQMDNSQQLINATLELLRCKLLTNAVAVNHKLITMAKNNIIDS